MSNEVAITLSFETPRDHEAEDYLQIAQGINEMFQQTRDVTLFRKCDGCAGQLHFRATTLDFKCQRCGIWFDLCHGCQRVLLTTHCPKGWGCEAD